MIGGEKEIFRTKKHWVAPVRDSWKAVLLIIVAFFIGWLSPNGEEGFFGAVGRILDLARTALFLVGVGWIVYNIVVWATAEFVLTNMRVLREEGLVSKRSSSTLLETVTDVKSRTGVFGRALGYGDLAIIAMSGEAGADRFTTITHPLEFRAKILEARMAAKQATGAAAPMPAPSAVAPVPMAAAVAMTSTGNPAAPAGPPPMTGAEAADTLARLADLRDKGMITPDEYDSKKGEILARM
jgi:hypothetical protein